MGFTLATGASPQLLLLLVIICISIATRRSGHGPTAAVRGAGEAQELTAGSPVPFQPMLLAGRVSVPLSAVSRASSLHSAELHRSSSHLVKSY